MSSSKDFSSSIKKKYTLPYTLDSKNSEFESGPEDQGAVGSFAPPDLADQLSLFQSVGTGKAFKMVSR